MHNIAPLPILRTYTLILLLFTIFHSTPLFLSYVPVSRLTQFYHNLTPLPQLLHESTSQFSPPLSTPTDLDPLSTPHAFSFSHPLMLLHLPTLTAALPHSYRHNHTVLLLHSRAHTVPLTHTAQFIHSYSHSYRPTQSLKPLHSASHTVPPTHSYCSLPHSDCPTHSHCPTPPFILPHLPTHTVPLLLTGQLWPSIPLGKASRCPPIS